MLPQKYILIITGQPQDRGTVLLTLKFKTRKKPSNLIWPLKIGKDALSLQSDNQKFGHLTMKAVSDI